MVVSAPKPKVASPVPDKQPERSGELPWGPVSSIVDQCGLCMALFGPPGVGKSTSAAGSTSSPHASRLLIVNFDGELRSLADRDDIQAWPKKDGGRIRDWSQADSFLSRLARMRPFPFDVVQIDTVNSMHDLARAHVEGKSSAGRDGRAIFGDANELCLGVISQYALLTRELGINVFFICHSEEKQEGENGPLRLRMALSPGMVKGIYPRVATIGALMPIPGGNSRRLYLHNTTRVVAKHHQPRTGPQLPIEIINPDMGRIIEHVKGIRPYPVKEKAK